MPPLRALLVDPSLYTAPYDAELTRGLVLAGVAPSWAVRPTRPGQREELGGVSVDPFFYGRIDRLERLPRALRSALKGCAHVVGLCQLLHKVAEQHPDVVHFQWAVLPALDACAMWLIRRRCPVVLTVHDTVPFNGQRLSLLQNLAFDLPIKVADKIVVHTQSGRDTLLKRGVARAKLSVIPHGPLPLHGAPHQARGARDARTTFVLFGEIKPYKGLDVLIEALALLPPALQERARVLVAGRPRMDLTALRARIAGLRLEQVVSVHAERLSEDAMAQLFAEADCFVFPYRQVDASGVYYLVKALGKWLIASRVGVFAEEVQDGVDGTLVAPGDVRELAAALALSLQRAPRVTQVATGTAWLEIGRRTRHLYEQARSEHREQVCA